MESSYKKSIKVMFYLPVGTHLSLLAPIRLKIDESNKITIRVLKKEAIADAMSDLMSNHRNLILLLGTSTVHKIKIYDQEKLYYYKIEETKMWTIKKIIDVR